MKRSEMIHIIQKQLEKKIPKDNKKKAEKILNIIMQVLSPPIYFDKCGDHGCRVRYGWEDEERT